MINLRDCPMCHKPQHDDHESGPVIRSENMINPDTCDDLGAVSYTVLCLDCGCNVSSEYLHCAVSLWNGKADAEGGAQ